MPCRCISGNTLVPFGFLRNDGGTITGAKAPALTGLLVDFPVADPGCLNLDRPRCDGACLGVAVVIAVMRSTTKAAS